MGVIPSIRDLEPDWLARWENFRFSTIGLAGSAMHCYPIETESQYQVYRVAELNSGLPAMKPFHSQHFLQVIRHRITERLFFQGDADVEADFITSCGLYSD